MNMNIKSSTIDWLISTLRVTMTKNPDNKKLISAFEDLQMGNINSLYISVDSDEYVENTHMKSDIIVADHLCIYPREHRVTRDDIDISLTPKEFDILYFLARNRGEVFTKEQIYQAVWEENYLLDDSNIMAFIRKIRKKIEPVPDAPQYIQTIWGIGYKFKA